MEVLLVGLDRSLIKGLHRKQHRITVWSPQALPREVKPLVSEHYKKDFDDPPLGGSFQAVVASADKTVLAAAALRERLGLPGMGLHATLAFRDKGVMKSRLKEIGIPMTPYLVCHGEESADELIAKLGSPLVLKEAQASGSRGLLISDHKKAITRHLRAGLLAETYIEGREFSLESFIYRGEILFTSASEYYQKGHINIVPAALSDSDLQTLKELNQKVLRHLEVDSGMTHLEAYKTADGFLFGEVALRPPGGYLMELLQLAYGIDPWDMYLDLQLGLKPDVKLQAVQQTASVIFHPGAGYLRGMERAQELERLEECCFLKLKAREGDLIDKRLGLGQNIGHALFKAQSRERLLEVLSFCEASELFDFEATHEV